MTDLKCRECGHVEPWESMKNSYERVEGYTAKVVCPECGHDKFDRQ